MSGVNKAMVLGNLGKDPEVRFTQGGQAVCNFSVATSETWTDKATGTKEEKTEWHRIVAWGKTAELCGQYLAKGRQVHVEGRIQTREYEKDGQKHYTTEIVADRVTFLGGRSEQPQATGEQSAAPAPVAGGPVFPGYGNAKGKPIAGATMRDLEFYADGAKRSLADPAKSRWHEQERALLAHIDAEIARQSGGSMPPAHSGPAAQDDIPF